MHCVLVSHFHWDREWYRTFQAYRARLVDAVDRVLDLLASDPHFRFVLDGQAVLIEDYLAIRPQRGGEIARGLRAGRLAAGPWYVQPDSLLPAGETHVRNLLEGRRVVCALGPASRVGYVPDSFGHPAQLPQLFAGFGIATFVHWRGNGDEVDELGSVYRWVAPDGSAVEATLLREGYFNAACLPEDAHEAARRLARLAARLAEEAGHPVLLMNGFDHMPPDAHAGEVAAALAETTGGIVERGLLEHAVGRPGRCGGTLRGELAGGRVASLLAGTWSARMPLKLRNRRCETLLTGWAEPWAALGRALGLPDERTALRLAWRTLLQNQAHDSLCGCALDAVAAQVDARFEDAEGLAAETVARLLERLAGLGAAREVPWTVEQEIAVFNPAPHPRTDVVRVPLDAYPALRLPLGRPEFAPLLLAAAGSTPGFAVGGQPVRVVASDDPRRTRWLPSQAPCDLEFVAADVPAFGCRRFRVTVAEPASDAIDDGREIAAGDVRVAVSDDGTLAVRLGATEWRGLVAVEDRGDRGDTYDFDPIDGDGGAALTSVAWWRSRHPSGLARLAVTRVFAVPTALDATRERRAAETVPLAVYVEARVAPGVPRVDLDVRVENAARDHRLRLLFPTGRPVGTFHAASTFDVAERTTAPRDDSRWLHRAPTTFPHQGWVSANGLTVVAPGLPEAEVTPDGTIAVTLLRAVGWLARFDLRTRPAPVGPAMPVAGAQVPGPLAARLALLAGVDPAAAWDAEVGLRGVVAGPAPALAAGRALLALAPPALLLSALKPAERGGGIVVRVLNPTDETHTAELRSGFPVRAAHGVRLDEEPAEHAVALADGVVRFAVPPRALRSVLLEVSARGGRRARVPRGVRAAPAPTS
ncbi:MAG TPA: glycosyl hydrolase-related protein [Candidatus Binatia bacterium]|nr:glycosyl hydrolase-related protein [Candidatus Binatia bacterium]